jgi:hypothetical protein
LYLIDEVRWGSRASHSLAIAFADAENRGFGADEEPNAG